MFLHRAGQFLAAVAARQQVPAVDHLHRTGTGPAVRDSCGAHDVRARVSGSGRTASVLVFGQTAMFFYLVHRLAFEIPATYFGLRGAGDLTDDLRRGSHRDRGALSSVSLVSHRSRRHIPPQSSIPVGVMATTDSTAAIEASEPVRDAGESRQRMFQKPTSGRRSRPATWDSSIRSPPDRLSMVPACASSRGRPGACGDAFTATTPTRGR